MATILSNSTLSTILLFLCTVLVMGLQHLFGYKNWKPLGWLLPVLLIGFVVYCFVQGKMTLSIRDIIMPLIGLLVLGSAYERGRQKANKRQNAEIERMKAQDNLK